MMLADKIMNLRRQKNWSQEDLAERLGISRQSVSKWESGASIPDIDKIIKLSMLFGVSTDYLLIAEKEEVILVNPVSGEIGRTRDTAENEKNRVNGEAGENVPAFREISYDAGKVSFSEEHIQEKSEFFRNISLEEAMEFLETSASGAAGIAVGVVLCILGAAFLIAMAGFAGHTVNPKSVFLTEEASLSLGLVGLLLFCAVGVAFLIRNGMKFSKYEFFETEPLVLEEGVKELAEKKKAEFEPIFRNCITAGVVLCIVAVIPLFAAAGIGAEDFVYTFCLALLLVIVSCAVFLFVWSGSIQESYNKILQVQEYTVENKLAKEKTKWFSGVYWCFVVAFYLCINFTFKIWNISWIIWPVAGTLFAALNQLVKNRIKKELE